MGRNMADDEIASEQFTFVYLCNAIDEDVKRVRSISTDSPAATNKVIAISRAVNRTGITSVILSLGRGRQNGTGRWHQACHRKLDAIDFYYGSFIHYPILTHFLTILSLAFQVIQIASKYKNIHILVYNRSYHYLGALLVARLIKLPCYLDLEDGFNVSGKSFLNKFFLFLMKKLFDMLCPAGAMVSISNLSLQLSFKNPLICYGVADDIGCPSNSWVGEKLQFIFSGTLLKEVGSQLLLEAIEILKSDYPDVFKNVFFVITGKGPYAHVFSDYAARNSEHVFFGGALLLDAYTKLLRESHVGISLRLSSFEMAKTTFPSKVIEYANNGLVVLSTRSADVPGIFGDSAVYLDEETPDALAKLIASLPNRVAELAEKSLHGMQLVRDCCGPDRVGKNIVNFFSNASD